MSDSYGPVSALIGTDVFLVWVKSAVIDTKRLIRAKGQSSLWKLIWDTRLPAFGGLPRDGVARTKYAIN